MRAPTMSFQVRLRSTDSLERMTERVVDVLGGRFEPAGGQEFEPGEAMEAWLLGLVVHVIGSPDHAGEEITYVVRGLTRPDVEAELDSDRDDISIGEAILGVFRIVDDPGWYIATEQELLDEAGL